MLKSMLLLGAAMAAIIMSPFQADADVDAFEWLGDYAMNHDGWQGSLIVADTKADCASPAWCSMAIAYIDSKGARHAGEIEAIDDNGQHMAFAVNFPGNRQKFDAYIFSWDKTKIAGLTYWGGRKFGFYAIKK